MPLPLSPTRSRSYEFLDFLGEGKRRRFHPLRGLRRMFRRKAAPAAAAAGGSRSDEEEAAAPAHRHDHDHRHLHDHHHHHHHQADELPQQDQLRCRSASELLAAEGPAARRRSGAGAPGGVGGVGGMGGGGLSLSHDSVFTAEQRGSCEDLRSASSLSIQQLVKDELLDAVRRRRSGQRRDQDTSEDTDEDLGLPRSPANTPPTTADVLLDKPLKENPTKSHSTCSDGSLLSMGSSEMDEDSMGQNSGHSSKLSLQDKKIYQENASDAELDIGVLLAVPLSHSAARHKMAVRPKRTHGAPRRHRMQQISAGSSLPTTPEVNEETSCRSISPEVKQRKECNPRRNKRNVLLHCWKW